jgi:deoxycytidylate deaminase
MKKMENSIDTYFKTKVDPVILEWDKNNAWEKLERKRTRNKIRYYSIPFAATIIVGLLLIIPKKTHKENDSGMSDFDKRQKLREYENKISGTYVETLLCYDCSGEIMKSQIKQVPEKQWILEGY